MKNIFFLIFFCFSLSLSALEDDFHYIRKKITNMYENANKSTAVVSQAVYAEAIKIIQKENDWSMIQTPDGYQGWIKTSHYISRSTPYPSSSSVIGKVKNLWTHIFFEKSIKNSAPFITLPFGTEIEIDDLFFDATDGWMEVRMLDDNIYWAQQNEFTINPKTLSLDEMLIQAKTFIGIPYLWSGKAAFGFDCSGFVQTLYLLMGIQLPRDSDLQADYIQCEKLDRSSLKKGDLVFFSEDRPLKESNEQNRVYHVGICLNKNTFIHCFGENKFELNGVQISNFQDQEWNDKFLYGKRVKFFNTNDSGGNIMFEDKDTQSIKNQFLEKLKELKKLNLPEDQYIIWGSGVLAIRGIRDASDIDIIVSKDY